MFILPSRGRPEEYGRFVVNYHLTKMTSPVLVCVDEDDPRLKDYQRIRGSMNIKLRVGPRQHIGPLMNEVFNEHPNEPWYGLMADDVIPPPYTRWDQVLVHYAGSTNLSFPDDGVYHEVIATHPIIGGEAVRAMGFIAYPGMNHYFIDTWWSEVMRGLNRCYYIPDFKLDHDQHIGAKIDTTFKEGFSWFQHDQEVWDTFRNDYSLSWETMWVLEEKLQAYERKGRGKGFVQRRQLDG
jgi:hypothetical protein